METSDLELLKQFLPLCFKEARSALDALRPVIFVFDKNCDTWHSELQNNILPSIRWHVFIGDLFPTLRGTDKGFFNACFHSTPHFQYCWAPEGIALICFTSGTTGKPKGVSIGHTALIMQSLAKVALVGYNENDVYLHTSPLCHVGGISSGLAMLMVGACHVIFPKFEAESVLRAIEEHQVSSFITVPTMMADLIACIRKRESWNGRGIVKKILNGGGGLSVKLTDDAAEVFSNAKLLSAYGMTEACSSLTFITLYEPSSVHPRKALQEFSEAKSYSTNRVGGICVGKPAPHVELQISSDGPSPVGRILTRGPHVMLKYWNQIPEATSDSGHGDWLDTGDIGWTDDSGNLWLIGRCKDRIKTGGENVYPEEVETHLSQHPGIFAVVVVGLPDARLSEMVVACVQIRENWLWINQNADCSLERKDLCVSSQILQDFCKERNLTGFKIPKMFIPWKKPFPLTSSGKLRREDIRKQARSHLQHLPSYL
ncbi:hypothetical protein Sjap_026508 [Stephania japonica]|uniref:4-coumarate--CoA ligase n=1 Tax=Stephania japonica TaxID=461633 RepID=A0AAP0HIK0_9MAGN